MKVLKWLLGGVVVLIALVLAVNFSKLPPAPAKDSVSGKRLQAGFYPVGQLPLNLLDRSRATQPNGPEYNGSPKRRLNGYLWYPAVEDMAVAPGLHPLVIFSHGFSSTYEGGAHIANYLAGMGYIVASVDYPLTNMNAPGGPLVQDVVNQPADVSFIIDQLLVRSATEGDALHGSIDPARIGLTGISLGGMTTLMTAYHPRWHDKRIAAAISLAGPSEMFGAEFYAHRKLPFMMVASPIDAMVDYQRNAEPVPDVIEGAWLVSIEGGSHTGFSAPASYLRWLDNPDSLGCYVVKQNLKENSEEEDAWYYLFGTPEEGIVESGAGVECPDPLPESINPLRQHQLVLLAVGAFFEMYFADTEHERQAARSFLSDGFAIENSEVSVIPGA